MTNRIEGAACQGVYDDSAMMCRQDEGVIASSANIVPKNDGTFCSGSESESKAEYYGNFLRDSENLDFSKTYEIDKNGSVTETNILIQNPEREVAEKQYREWGVAQDCGKRKDEILNGVRVLGDNYHTWACFESTVQPIGIFARVLDLATDSVLEANDKERRYDHNMIAVDVTGKTFHAAGLKDGQIGVIDMFRKKFDRNLVGTPPPPEKLAGAIIIDVGNDHITDFAEVSLASRDYFAMGGRATATDGALALFDQLWEDKTLPDSYRYVQYTRPDGLEMFVNQGDAVDEGDKLFTLWGKTFLAEASGTVGLTDYLNIGRELVLTIDVEKKGFLARLF